MADQPFKSPVGDTVPRIDDQIAVGEDLEFQRKWWRFERIVWSIFVVILICDLLGLFGRGWLAKATRTTPDGALKLNYERIERADTPSIMTLHFNDAAIQSFFFNAVFFTYRLVVKRFFHVVDKNLPIHLLPFAVASFLGPLTLGRLFDKIGRKPMITITYAVSGLLLVGLAVPFAMGAIGSTGLEIGFSVIFYVASSAASAAYLTVSEIFPLEIRAIAIAVFYALGTLIGGVGAPLLFGVLIATGSHVNVAMGYGLGGVLMLGAAICEHFIGIEAAGKSLESISKPLQSS
jgi:MFS family permease